MTTHAEQIAEKLIGYLGILPRDASRQRFVALIDAGLQAALRELMCDVVAQVLAKAEAEAHAAALADRLTRTEFVLARYRVLMNGLVDEWWDMDTGNRSGGGDDTSIYSDLSDDLRIAVCQAEGHDWQPLPADVLDEHPESVNQRHCSKCKNYFTTTENIEADEADLNERIALLALPQDGEARP